MDERIILKRIDENTKTILELLQEKNRLDDVRLRMIEKRIQIGDDDFSDADIRELTEREKQFDTRIRTEIGTLKSEIDKCRETENIDYKV
ncbi:MAG: hypothetical protein ABH879_07285 [archaeon]